MNQFVTLSNYGNLKSCIPANSDRPSEIAKTRIPLILMRLTASVSQFEFIQNKQSCPFGWYLHFLLFGGCHNLSSINALRRSSSQILYGVHSRTPNGYAPSIARLKSAPGSASSIALLIAWAASFLHVAIARYVDFSNAMVRDRTLAGCFRCIVRSSSLGWRLQLSILEVTSRIACKRFLVQCFQQMSHHLSHGYVTLICFPLKLLILFSSKTNHNHFIFDCFLLSHTQNIT